VAALGENRNTLRVLVEQREGKRAVRRPRPRGKNIAIMNLTAIEGRRLV
jgi:hypothetical protein